MLPNCVHSQILYPSEKRHVVEIKYELVYRNVQKIILSIREILMKHPVYHV